jgi:hypothetical protein
VLEFGFEDIDGEAGGMLNDEDLQLVAEAWREQQAQPPPMPEPPPPPAAPPADLVTQLRELADLKDQGILTQQEFDAQKARLLGS